MTHHERCRIRAQEQHGLGDLNWVADTPDRMHRGKRLHLFALHPKLIAFVAYVDEQYGAEVRARADEARAMGKPARDQEQLFAPFLARNPYYCGLYDDPRFAQEFRVVDVVRRKDTYWFVLFERLTPTG